MLPGMQDASTATEAPGLEESESNPLKDSLTATVQRRIKEAMDARQASGIEEVWDADADQYDGIDALSSSAKGVKDERNSSRDEATDQHNARSKVFLNITKPKTDAAVARVQEMLVPHDDKPWEIGPTPIPELVDAAGQNLQEQLTLADGTQASASDVARVALNRANEKAKKMADWIEDQFVEGSVYAEMRKVIRDAGRIGSGVLKGPFPVARTSKKWQVSNGTAILQMVKETRPSSRRIDPRDFFPDPACGENIHNGSYVVERDYLTARQLRQLAMVEGYDRKAIVQALKEGPKKNARDNKRFRDVAGETVNDSDVFEVFYYYGDVEPEMLLAMGVTAEAMGIDMENPDEELLYLTSIPSIVTMVNDLPIKAAINPLETGEFPFDIFPWEPVDGQPWGRGVPRKMSVAQKILVAAVRALLENAGVSSGPQVGITDTLVPLDGSYGITGRKLWRFTPNEFNADINKAMAVWTIPSVQAELSAIIDFALKMADELTNLPMILQGQQGSAPDLLGGMQMLMQNAQAPLRVIAKQYDDYLIVPHLKRYYDWGMQSGPADGKGDMQIKARGSTALVQREIAREFLMQLYGISKDEALRINPAKLATEMARANGFSLESIQYTEDEWAQMQKAKEGHPPPQDPRIEAANIKAEVDRQRMQIDQQEAALDRAHEAAIKRVELQIQALEFAGQRDVTIEQIKAMLATEAVKSRDRRELFVAERALKMDPANTTNQGV